MSLPSAAFFFLSLLISVFNLTTQEGGNSSATESEGPDPEEEFKQLFSAVDKDGNGKISLAEAIGFWQAKSKTMDPEELKKKLDKFNAKTLDEAVERGFKKVDKDVDGNVSPNELKAYLQS